MSGSDQERGLIDLPVMHGVRVSIRNNASAYPFSVFITVCFAMVDTVVGDREVGRLFLFVLGATAAFGVVEALVSHGFRDRIRPERSEIIVLGSALSMVSVTAAVGTAWAVSVLLGGSMAWFVAPFVGTTVYLFGSSLEMALARRREEDEGHASEDEREDEGDTAPDEDDGEDESDGEDADDRSDAG